VTGRHATRGAAGVGGILAGLLGLTIVVSPPSQAESKQLLVSNTPAGPFSDNLATPLFADTGPWVPNDRASRTFYVKNNSQDVARTTVAVVNRSGPGDFVDALTFDVDLEGTTTTGALPAAGSEDCGLVATGPNIGPGELQAVDISMAVADLEGQQGMNHAASLDFVVTLTQSGPDGQIDVCGAQAEAEPEVRGVQDHDEDADQCQRDVVVTAVGDPTCVPTVVAAGTSSDGTEPREPAVVAGWAGVLLAIGGSLVIWASRRRRDEPAP